MINYNVTDNGYCAMPPYDAYDILEIKDFEPLLRRKYQELLSQKHDLDRAAACLNQMFLMMTHL